MHNIVAVRWDGRQIGQVKLEDGSVHNVVDAISLAQQGLIENVSIGTDRNGFATLRSRRDSKTNNNLRNLPTF